MVQVTTANEMESLSMSNSESKKKSHRAASHWLALIFTTFFMCFSLGCQSVTVTQQGLVARESMTFSESAVFQYQGSLFSQIEPGAAGSGGAQAAGCTSCK